LNSSLFWDNTGFLYGRYPEVREADYRRNRVTESGMFKSSSSCSGQSSKALSFFILFSNYRLSKTPEAALKSL
jgi:hypothetical protein